MSTLTKNTTKQYKFYLNSVSSKLKHMIKSPKILLFKSIAIFLFFFSLFLSVHLFNGRFTSYDDPYYHIKHAFLIEQSGKLDLVESWLEFHFFNYAPTDPWWGFHLAMALFIHYFGLFLGVKIFISLLATLVFLVFYLVLDKLKVRYPLAWTLLLFFSSINFSYRLFLERPHLLSIIFFTLAFLFLVKNKNFWLFVLSVFYALCYNSAPLIILLALAYVAVDAWARKQINLKPLIASSGGVLAGIIIHPTSLNYCYIIFTQLWKVAFINISGIDLHLGGESRTRSFYSFLHANYLAFVFMILAVALFLYLKKIGKSSVIGNFLFFCSSLWLFITLILPRGVDYWLPAVIVFTAVIFSDFLATEEFNKFNNWLTDKINFKIVNFFLIGALVLIIISNASNVISDLGYNNTNTEALNENYRNANDWLKANTEKGSIIFYNRWDMWPIMFFYNSYNHYIVGMDPTFLYEYDERIYWLWRNISIDGLYCDQADPCLALSPAKQIKLVPLAIKNIFQAKYVIVPNYQGNLIKVLNNLKGQARAVFENEDLLIYEIK